MGRFAAFVILFAFAFAMVAPDDFGGLAPRESRETSKDEVLSVDRSADDAETAPPMELRQSSDATVIERGSDGQFHLDVAVNGTDIPFLIDTGADQVALTVDDARRVGILVEPQYFEPVGMGAGGVVRGQRVSIDSVSVAGHDLGELDAVVIDGLTHNLLGQSVLKRVGGLEMSGDTMTLR